MRHILIAAAALAAFGFVSTTARAQQGQPAFEGGGPAQVAGWCKVTTDGQGNDTFGYYEPCSNASMASEPRRSRRHGYGY